MPFQFAICVIQNLYKWRRPRRGQEWRNHHPINCQQCSESLRNKTITSVLANNHQRPQFFSILACSTGHSCVSLVWFRVSHDNSDTKIAQLLAITQPTKKIITILIYIVLVHHLKARNVKASICPWTCQSFCPSQNKSCSSSRRYCCHGLTDSNIVYIIIFVFTTPM